METSNSGNKHLCVVVATHNRGKIAEYRAILGDLPIQLLPLHDALPAFPALTDDAASLEDSASHKAQMVGRACRLVTIADASGLEVQAIGGRPGVRSARFAKEGATDAENNAALLAALEDVEDPDRRAQFRCTVALLDPWAETTSPLLTHGVVEGRIARQTSGSGGFAYETLFLVDGKNSTLAELEAADKHLVSHRSKALSEMRPYLERMLKERLQSAAVAFGDSRDGWR